MTDIVKGFADFLASLSDDPAQDSAEPQKRRTARLSIRSGTLVPLRSMRWRQYH